MHRTNTGARTKLSTFFVIIYSVFDTKCGLNNSAVSDESVLGQRALDAAGLSQRQLCVNNRKIFNADSTQTSCYKVHLNYHKLDSVTVTLSLSLSLFLLDELKIRSRTGEVLLALFILLSRLLGRSSSLLPQRS